MRKALWVGLGAFAVAAPWAGADDWSHQYTVKGRPELRLTTDDGSVRVEVGTGSQIEAQVTTEGWKIAPGELTISRARPATGSRSRCGCPRTMPSSARGTAR